MKTTVVYRGRIEGFSGSWMSGIGYLIIGGKPVPCENAPTVRALDGCFGNVIASGHCVNNKAIKGKDIVYSVDDIGVLEAFTPTSDWRSMHGDKKTPKMGGSVEIETKGGEKDENGEEGE